MKDLLLNKVTRTQAKTFIASPSHALLVSGEEGSGKAALAKSLAAALLGLKSEHELQNYPYFTHLSRPEGKQDIPIDSIRSLNKLLKLKAPGAQEIRRVVLIENSQDLNDESSNALLKMLEEPAADCVFILTAPSASVLLPTISSRAQQLSVRPVSLSDAIDFLGDSYKEPDVRSAWRLSQGAAGLMLAILHDDKDHPLKVAIDEAKGYLRKDKYGRLLLADSLSKDKKRLALTLEALARLLAAVQQASPNSGAGHHQKNLLNSRKLVHKLQDALNANASPKLVAMELSLNLL